MRSSRQCPGVGKAQGADELYIERRTTCRAFKAMQEERRDTNRLKRVEGRPGPNVGPNGQVVNRKGLVIGIW